MTAPDIGVSIKDDFFDDIESCSIEPTNLNEVVFIC